MTDLSNLKRLRKNASSALYMRKKYIPIKEGGKRPLWRISNPERFMWLQAKHSALRKGVPFSIQPSDIIIPEVCPVLGIPLFRFGNRDNSPSLDRIVGSLGYVSGNIAVISGRANRIKNDSTLEELIKITEYVKCSMPLV